MPTTTEQLLSIQVGQPRTFGHADATEPHDAPWTTGIFKEHVDGPVFVGFTNIAGDGQADLSVHGGVDKAVLAYSAEHFPFWRNELHLPDFGGGAFGENLTLAGLTEQEVCIGDVWQFGEALLQVSQPRQPCWKLGQRWRLPTLPKRVIQTGYTGWYFRVLREGMIAPGEITLVERPHPDWTIQSCNAAYYNKSVTSEKRELAAVPALSASWKADIRS